MVPPSKAGGSSRQARPPVYPQLAKHQREERWFGQQLLAELQTWVERYIVEFKLDIPEVVLCIEPLPRTRYAQFRYGRNKFGLRGEIAFNARYLDGKRPWWEVLGTLLHELLHAWQQAHGVPGKRNHHNAEFRVKAAELGLNIDRRGVTGYQAHSRFQELLLRFGIEAPLEDARSVVERLRGEPKMKKWTCGCANIRAATEVNLRCLDCGNPLHRSDQPGRARHARRRNKGA